MAAAVREVDHEAEREPDHEAHPRLPRQSGDEHGAERDGEDRRDGHARGAETAVGVRLRVAHPQHAGRHDDEGRECADVHELEQHVDVDEAAGDGGEDAEEPCALPRRVVLLVHLAEELREQAVAAHGVADARLAVQLHEHDGGHADQRAEVHDERQPVQARGEDDAGHRRVHELLEVGVLDDARHDERHRDVQDGGDDQRVDDAARQRLVRLDGLLGGRGDGVESDEAEEHDGCGRDDAHGLRGARLEGVDAVRGERMPVARVDVPHGAHDEQDDDGELDHDHDVVRALGLVDAHGEHRGDDEHDDEAWQVEIRRYARRGAVGGGQLGGDVDVETLEQLVEVARPAGRDSGRLQGVFQDEVPADDERDEFAERHVGVGVRRARDGHHGGELRVAQAGEAAADGGQQERDAQGRASRQGALAGEDEDAGADDRTDAEHRQVEGLHCAFQRGGGGGELLHGFLAQQL